MSGKTILPWREVLKAPSSKNPTGVLGSITGELRCDGKVETDGASFELALDFLRLRMNRFIFLAVVCDPEESSVSEELEELEELEDVDESRKS